MSRWSMRGRRWAKVAEAVKERDGHRCQQCGATEDLTVDHLIPVVELIAAGRREDAYDEDMLATLCRPCNSSKQDNAAGRPELVNPRWSDVLGLVPRAGR